MALQKQPVNIPFGVGINTKSDPNQVPLGQMLELQNAVFNTDNLLAKRNGFAQITALPSGAQAYSLCTYSGNLLAIGTDLYSYSQENSQWLDRGKMLAADLSVTPLVRSNGSKVLADSAVASNGLVCTVYKDTACHYKITKLDGSTVVADTALPATAVKCRVNALGGYFIISFIATVSASPHLQYIAIPIGSPTLPGSATDISTQVKALAGDFDTLAANSNVYFIWNGSDGGGAVRVTYLTSSLTIAAPVIFAGYVGDITAIGMDNSTPANLYCVFYNDTTKISYGAILSAFLVSIVAPVTVSTTATISRISVAANDTLATIFFELPVTYAYDGSILTNAVTKITLSYAGVVGTPADVVRSVGLASKAFYSDGSFYFLGAYGDPSHTSQPSYFFLNGDGEVLARLAYSNGSGYLTTTVLPSINADGNEYTFAYLYKDQIVAVNKTQALPGIVNGVYSQLGINLASITINSKQYVAELGNNLNITGGQLWTYDGNTPVEQGFSLWPETIEATVTGTGGSITAQQYYYQFTYEWTDAQGNIHRSAPSIPLGVTVAAGTTNTVTLHVPTLRVTAKTQVRLVGYRWSAAQQAYYQFTSISSPTLNDKTQDSLNIADTLADSAILGNPLLYTTGGVVEDIGAPACSALTLFKSRLFLVDAEDRNLIWYSKQVIEGTPVEMSDLLTIYIAPTIGAQGSTGNITALSSMDDKLIIFKKDAIYYVTGNGPDNTGANNDFSEPVFVTSVAGCTNQNSIVSIPQGLMFQSDKGIWLLGRDLSTSYIGASVQGYNDALVESALNISGTNQVRFTLDTGITLMYDFYQQQWCTFNGIPALSSVLYGSLHTYLDSQFRIFQETPDSYLDGSSPVLMSFLTPWIKLTGLQGFQRAYYFFLLGKFLSPHKLQLKIAYDYNPAITQSVLITPDNSNVSWGSDALWGSGSPWGGGSSVEQWRVFLSKQKCQSIQIGLQEFYDASIGPAAGAGLTLSGINLIIGGKAGMPKLNPSRSAG